MKSLKRALATLAAVAALGASGQVMAKPCNTTISFKTNTKGKALKVVYIKTYVGGNLTGKKHKPTNLSLTDGGTVNLNVKLAQKCDYKRRILVKALDDQGREYIANSKKMGKGVMNFGSITFDFYPNHPAAIVPMPSAG